MSSIPDFTVDILHDVLVMIELASQRGVFKVAHYPVVGAIFNTHLPMAKKQVDFDVSPETAVTMVNILKHAADANGFAVQMFAAVSNVIAILTQYIRNEKPELIVDADKAATKPVTPDAPQTIDN